MKFELPALKIVVSFIVCVDLNPAAFSMKGLTRLVFDIRDAQNVNCETCLYSSMYLLITLK